jgi:hypothetical protein
MDQETERILQMVQDGKITAAQAATLLDAIEETPAARAPSRPARMLRIQVTDRRNGRARVNINLPIGLVEVIGKMGMTLGVKNAPELANINFEEIMSAIKSGAHGQIIDVEDDDDHEHVTISVD